MYRYVSIISVYFLNIYFKAKRTCGIIIYLTFILQVWFNNKGWASSVSYMNAMNNIILRSHLPPGANSSYYGISVINHPMNFTQDQLKDEVLYVLFKYQLICFHVFLFCFVFSDTKIPFFILIIFSVPYLITQFLLPYTFFSSSIFKSTLEN